MASSHQQSDYSRWSIEQLIERVTALESQLHEETNKFAIVCSSEVDITCLLHRQVSGYSIYKRLFFASGVQETSNL